MFNALWKMREGFVTGAGLILVGLLLQYTAGPIDWSAFAFPVNAIVLALYLLLLVIIYALRHRVRLFSYLFTVEAAVPTLIYAAILTVAMGLTRQVAPHERAIDPIGLTRMLSFWPFVLIYARLTGIVGLIAIRQILHFRLREVPSLLSHIGLFIAIVAATLGSADMERVKLKATTDMPEWRATHDQGFMELPLAIQLEKFTIDEYPPKLALIGRGGFPLPKDKPENLLLDKGVRVGQLLDCKVEVLKRIDNAVPAMLSKMIGKMPTGMMGNIRMDSLGQARNKDGYIASDAAGSACALLVKVTTNNAPYKGVQHSYTGWVTSGSYLFPYQALRLDDGRMLAMPNREPRRFASLVDIYTKSGQNIQTEIEVNKPFSIEGWTIYQLSYNEQMGKWSNLSIFELVTDPWLPVVYVGIFMLLIGAVGMFLTASRKKENQL